MKSFSRLVVSIALLLLNSVAFGQTTLIKDINTGAAEFQPSWDNTIPFFDGGNVLYFKNGDKTGGELWKTNGTVVGTGRVVDLNKGRAWGFLPGQGTLTTHYYAQGGIALGNKFLFVGDNGSTGGELFLTDGTAGGTSLVKDIYPGTNSSYPNVFLNFHGKAYFSALDGTNMGMWMSDGTSSGTIPLITFESANINVYEVAQTSSLFFFAIQRYNSNTYEMWSSDGTPSGTFQLHSFPGATYDMAVVGDRVFFPAGGVDDLGNSITQLWSSDGTIARTNMVYDFQFAGASNLFSYGNKVMLTSNNDQWVSDGTQAGTKLLYSNFFMTAATTIGNTFYAVGYTNAFTSDLFLKSDGTPDGTEAVVDIGASVPQVSKIEALNNKMFLSVYSTDIGTELGISDGTTAGTVLLKDINPGANSSNPRGFKSFQGKIYFIADDGVNGNQIWSTDGTAGGTVMLANLTPGTLDSSPSWLQVLNDKLYFDAVPAAVRYLFIAHSTRY